MRNALLKTLGLFAALGLMAGCAGTKTAYEAAEGFEETGYVMSQHFVAVVAEANRLNEIGALTGANLRSVQDMVSQTDPIIAELEDTAQLYGATLTRYENYVAAVEAQEEGASDPETEAQLLEDIRTAEQMMVESTAEAAAALSRLIRLLRGSAHDAAEIYRGPGEFELTELSA